MHAFFFALLARYAAVDDAVQLVMRTQHVAGLSIGIERGGEPLYEHGYGLADVERRIPATAETVYRIGSLTKAFTAAAIGRLAAWHRIRPDAPVAAYVAHVAWAGQITIEDLLAQRSAIPSYTDDTTLNPYAWYAPDQLLASVAGKPLLFAPGTRFAYSNTNYVLLGMIAQQVTREPFEDFLQSAVIAPRGLHSTRYGDQPGEALGYTWNGAFVRSTPSSPAYAFAAAAMSSDTRDLLRFLDTLEPPYFGLLQSERFGRDLWYASGNVNGYSAFELLVPQTHDAAVILCNADEIDLAPLAMDVLAAIEPQQTPGAGFGPPQNENPRTRASVARLVGQRLASMGPVTLLEFLGDETRGGANAVLYRVTFSNGTQLLLHAVLTSSGDVEDISVWPL